MPVESSLSAQLLVWLALLGLVAAAAAAIGVWIAVARLRDLERAARQLERLDDLRAGLQKLVGDRSDLDLRRLEHVLIEIRDGQRRLEDALMRLAERSHASDSGGLRAQAGLPERIETRLYALGYERIQLITPREEIERIGVGDGEVIVEARRAGAPCKGRVIVRGGALADVSLQPAYAAFP